MGVRVIKATCKTDYVIIRIILEKERELERANFFFIKGKRGSKEGLKGTRKRNEGEGGRGGG